MNILEVNKSCFKDCFYSFSRVDVYSYPIDCSPLPMVSSSSLVLISFFGSNIIFPFSFSSCVFPNIVKCVFSFTNSHRRSLPTFRWVGSIVFLPKRTRPVGETLPSFPAAEHLHPSPFFPGEGTKRKHMEPSAHGRAPKVVGRFF